MAGYAVPVLLRRIGQSPGEPRICDRFQRLAKDGHGGRKRLGLTQASRQVFSVFQSMGAIGIFRSPVGSWLTRAVVVRSSSDLDNPFFEVDPIQRESSELREADSSENGSQNWRPPGVATILRPPFRVRSTFVSGGYKISW
jgi:hypothetical protein